MYQQTDEKPNADIFGDSVELDSVPSNIPSIPINQPVPDNQYTGIIYNNNDQEQPENKNESPNPDIFGASIDHSDDQQIHENLPQSDHSEENNQCIPLQQPNLEVNTNQPQTSMEPVLQQKQEPEQKFQTQYQEQQYFPQKKKSQAKIKHQQQQPQQQQKSWFDILTFGLCSTKSAATATADVPKEEKKLTPYEKVNKKYEQKFQVLTSAEQKEQDKKQGAKQEKQWYKENKITKEEIDQKYTKKFEEQMNQKDIEEEQARKEFERKQKEAARVARKEH